MANQISPELERLIEKLVGEEKEQFFARVGKQLPHTIRFNTLKGSIEDLSDFLREQDFDFEPLPGFQNIFRIKYQPYPIGKSLSHFLGHIYVQDLASMIPPLVLAPEPGDWVLDISAAPGSKTTQMAALMQNRGVLIANDVVMKRLRALANNLQRMGVVNTAIFKWYGEQYGNQYFEVFDKILLDPACSGLGTLHKSPEVLGWWTPNHCTRLAKSQKSLIISAIKALRPGGVLVYSTCTLTPEENEEIVDFALRNYPVELEEINLPGIRSRPGLTEFDGRSYHASLHKAIRIYPIDNESEGFFVACLRKTEALQPEKRSWEPRKTIQMPFLSYKTSPVKKHIDYLKQQFAFDDKLFKNYRYLFEKKLIAVSKEMEAFPFRSRPFYFGLQVARPMTLGAKLTTEGCHLWGVWAQKNTLQLLDPESLEKFVNREAISITVEQKGQIIIRYKNIVIGYGITDNGLLKSQFPKGEWPFIIKPVSPLEK